MNFKLSLIFLLLSTISYSQINSISVGESFKQFANNAGNISNSLATFTLKEDTEGSPYLMKSWAEGQVVLKTKQVFTEPENLMNYDKVNNRIILKISDTKIVDVNMEQIESFILFDSSTSFKFRAIPEKSGEFFIELYRDSSFTLYKTIETRFYRADYTNKGLYESGHKFDRYVDNYTYYIKPSNGTLVTVKNLTKKGLKQLSEAIPQARTFIDSNNPESDTDAYLTKLTMSLSKHS